MNQVSLHHSNPSIYKSSMIWSLTIESAKYESHLSPDDANNCYNTHTKYLSHRIRNLITPIWWFGLKRAHLYTCCLVEVSQWALGTNVLHAVWDFKFSRRRVWCSELSSGIYCRVKWLSTDVSEVWLPPSSEIHPWWWRQYAPVKRRSTIILHSSISQKTTLNIVLHADWLEMWLRF
jgi:hypothetical protein